MRTTKCMTFTRKKRFFDKNYEPIGGGGIRHCGDGVDHRWGRNGELRVAVHIGPVTSTAGILN